MVIDQHPVITKFIEPNQSELNPAEMTTYDEVWFKDHVRTSQYCLQIVKCDNSKYCVPWRSSFRIYHYSRQVLPPLLPVAQTVNGLKALEGNGQSYSHYLGLFQRLSMNGQLNTLLPQSAHVFHIWYHMTFIVHQFRMIYKIVLVRHVVCILQVKRCFSNVIFVPSEKTHIDRSAQPALQQTTTREHTATTEHVVDN